MIITYNQRPKMRPSDFKLPFERRHWRIELVDRIWFVPVWDGRDQSYEFPGWSAAPFFGNNNPVRIEYCSGNGTWIAAKARDNPGINWVAIEKKFKRVKKIWSKIKNLQLPNLIVICGEALDITKRFIPDGTVEQVYINFPDPWPKKRHAKNRLIEPVFVGELFRILQEGGALTLVTDDAPYSEQMIEVTTAHSQFCSVYPNKHFSTDWQEYGTSFFDNLWREKGREIRYHQFTKGEAVECKKL